MKHVQNKWTLLCVTLLILGVTSTVYADRSVEVLTSGWRFARGEQVDAAKQATFYDSAWETVRVPHDWAIAGPFDESANGYAGKLPWQGQGWYRRSFTLKQADAGKRVYFDFDGVMAFSKVYINGRLAGQWDYGYSPFRVDATEFVSFGQANTLAVHVDMAKWGTRWYPGAGIYRKVILTMCSPTHIAHWGQFITTPTNNPRNAPNTVRVRTTLENHGHETGHVTIQVALFDPDGTQVAVDERIQNMAAQETCEVDQAFHLTSPRLWDIGNPNLYSAKTTISQNGKVLDSLTSSFGVRSFEFTANDGFYLNGKRVQLYGVNLHHDQGPLGAAFHVRAMERQLEIMQDMGVNALRTSHNPPAAEVLDLCDRMGIVVWDEVFDKWDRTAGRQGSEPPLKPFSQRQIDSVVKRDRNHPCVVIWSIGNEISAGGQGVTPERVAYMCDFVRANDPTRPVGMGCHIPNMCDQPNFDAMDLTGWNYGRRYEKYREAYPSRPIIYSESASTLSTRGFYDLNLPDRKNRYSDNFQVSSYDLSAADWSDIPDKEFALMEDDRFVAGEFVWTGFDYIGEPTPFSKEAKSSYFGVVDLCGMPKDRFYLYRSHWRPDVTTVHILPHWNWPDQVGKTVPVFVYTNGDSAELFLNGQSLGKRQKGQVPERSENYALTGVVSVSSEQTNHGAGLAIDQDRGTRWTAGSGESGQWWQIDLKETKPLGFIALEFEREEKLYAYEIKVSQDAQTWSTMVTKPTRRTPRWGGPKRIFHEVDTEARFVRIEFTELQNKTWASLQEVGLHGDPVESDYYDVTYSYRLRWNDVTYAPGELKAVAYKDGQVIGDAVMRTAGPPAQLRLTADRSTLKADGDDLSYISVDILDTRGTLNAVADNLIQFEVSGPAEIVGVGNGNPLSVEPFGADYRKLFYGKAMVIVRALAGKKGSVRVRATSDGIRSDAVNLRVR